MYVDYVEAPSNLTLANQVWIPVFIGMGEDLPRMREKSLSLDWAWSHA